VRRTAAEKMEIIRLVEGADLPVRATLRQLGIPRSTFYGWYQRYLEAGFDGLQDKQPARRAGWNWIPKAIQDQILELALERTDLSPRELACRFTEERRYFVSESSVYRLLKAADLITSPAYVLMSASDAFKNPTTRVHEMWQTDFTYFRIVGWGWYYLSTVLDDFSRYIIAWKLSPTMGASDVTETLDEALAITGADQVKVRHRPRLLSDNGPAYVSGELREYLGDRGMAHTRGAPYHPQTQGKIERYHRTMKNVVKLEHYYFPWELEAALRDFTRRLRLLPYYNNERYHESLDNVTPADVYFGRQYAVISKRAKIKRLTMHKRKQEYLAERAA
jgi:putative transposase